MSKQVKSATEIPSAPLYVLANDSFMSGWGDAKNRTNTVILPCADAEEAAKVVAYVKSRPEMKRVRTLHRKPTLRAGILYSLMTREEAPVWFGGYKPQFCVRCAREIRPGAERGRTESGDLAHMDCLYPFGH
jgi:hypothetical protein